MTLKPASANALAISKCVWFGVATDDEIDPFVPGSFASAAIISLIGAVSALGGDVVIRGGGLGLGRIGRQGAGDERGAVVEDGRDGVDAADERALAAADQAHAQFAIEGCVDGHGEPQVETNATARQLIESTSRLPRTT